MIQERYASAEYQEEVITLRKIIGIVLLISVVLGLCSCGKSIKKDEGSETKSVENQEITLNLATFGERNGKYSGEMLNDLPQGFGKFESQNSEGTGWVYEGEWVSGQFHGEGYLYWPSNGQKYEGTYRDSDLIKGKCYIRDTLTYKGDFTSYTFDGTGTFYNHKGEAVYTGPFTAGAPSDLDTFIAATRDIHYDDYAKDITTYRADPIRFTGSIIQLWEDDGSGVRNYVVSLDDSNEQLLFVYDYRMRLGLDVELQESDIITGYGLTTAAFTYESKSGTSVTSPAVLTFFVESQNTWGTDSLYEGELAKGLTCYYGTETGIADFDKAEAAFQTAADAGVADAWYYLGRIAYQRSDYQNAAAFFETGAEQGSELARFNLGMLYENGEGLRLDLDVDYEKARELFQEAVDHGCIEANCGLGDIYQNGYGVEADNARALEYFLLAAESNDPEWAPYAWLSVCEASLSAEAVEPDGGQPDDWKEKFLEGETALAEAGLPKASFFLAFYYYNGSVDEPDYATAMTWFRKAAEAGDARSMYFIAYMYSKGLGVEENQEESMNWYLKSAEAGYLSSMYNVGRRYELGNGVEQNTEKAIEWYQKAAKAGNKKAAERLAELTGT